MVCYLFGETNRCLSLITRLGTYANRCSGDSTHEINRWLIVHFVCCFCLCRSQSASSVPTHTSAPVFLYFFGAIKNVTLPPRNMLSLHTPVHHVHASACITPTFTLAFTSTPMFTTMPTLTTLLTFSNVIPHFYHALFLGHLFLPLYLTNNLLFSLFCHCSVLCHF